MRQHFLLKGAVVLASLLLGTVGLYAQDYGKSKPKVDSVSCDDEVIAPNGTYTPMFSWKFTDGDLGDAQTAYLIQVGTSAGLSDMGNLTENLATGARTYSGRPLAPNTTYYWSLQVWDRAPQASDTVYGSFEVPDIGLRVFDGASTVAIVAKKVTGPVSDENRLRISKGGITYGIALVNPTDGGASKLRVQIAPGANGTKALKMMVAPPPAVGLDPGYLDFSAVAGGADPSPQTVSVLNTGGGTHSDLTADVSPSGSGWLEAKLVAPATLKVTPTRGTLAAGTYRATVTVASGTAGINPQTLSVTLVVYPVSTPTFSPPAGTYTSAQNVTISSTTPGASIRYTTDGSTPTSTLGTLYAGPISVAVSETLHAIAYEPGWTDSAVAAATYTLPAAAPTFSPAAGTYYSAQNVTISTTTPGASIRYTTDGSIPTRTYGTLYAGPISVAVSETLSAIAYHGGSDSTVSTAAYAIYSPGTLDTTFATGAGANGRVWSVAVQSDGKVLIGGNFTSYNGISRGYVARLNSDGSLDTGFLATGNGADGLVCSVAVQSDGKILIGGYFTTYNGTSRGNVARLNSDGSLDTGFLASVYGNEGVWTVAVQSDGKILIGGFSMNCNGTSRNGVARLNIDGSLDTGFLATGSGANDLVRSIAVQSNGKILIGGDFIIYNGINRGHVARLNIDGSLDTGFSAAIFNNVTSVALQSDGKVLIVGLFLNNYNGIKGGVARLNSDGSLDTGFLTYGDGTYDTVESIVVQYDGKILIGGVFSTFNDISRVGIARLNSDGYLDSGFFSTVAQANGPVRTIAVQSDGKILIGGGFNNNSGTSRGYVARLWN